MAQFNSLYVEDDCTIDNALVNTDEVYPLGAGSDASTGGAITWTANSSYPTTGFSGKYRVIPSKNHDIIIFYLHLKFTNAITAPKDALVGTMTLGTSSHELLDFACPCGSIMMNYEGTSANTGYKDDFYLSAGGTGQVTVHCRFKNTQVAGRYIVIGGCFLSTIGSLA